MHQPGEPHVDIILDRIKQVIARDNRPTDGARPARGNLSPVLPARAVQNTEVSYDQDYDSLPIEPADADEAAEVLELEEDEIVPQSAMRPSDTHFRDVDPEEHLPAIPLDQANEYEGEEDLIAYDWSEPEGLGEAGDDTTQEAEPIAPEQPSMETAPLTSTQTREAARDNLAALSMLSTLSRERQARGLDDTSIEALTRDLLRPMLADWLDANLPSMVERLVQAEIRRIVGEGG